MVILTGENLGKRQHEINTQVNEAVAKKLDFEKARAQNNASDVDKLYLIDLASKYKNVDYIIEVLKGGDSLCISRALKCTWLYDDNLSNIINADYLHHNIFPSMSFKMKRKFLTAISMHVKNEQRASNFYTYCNNIKLHNIALKFLIFTSESFKLDIIKSLDSRNKIANQKGDYLLYFIGNSITLATKYLPELGKPWRTRALFQLRYLFSVSEKEYLDLLERFNDSSKTEKLGLRITKCILKSHKERILKNPSLYLNILNKSLFFKYVTVSEAQKCAIKLLPESAKEFWDNDYVTSYEFVLEIIPTEERFKFLKKIFNEKYPKDEFEMSKMFFESQSYRFMTSEERHNWALEHVESKKEIQGAGRDYLWYKFVEFKVSFPEIKKYVMTTSDLRKRASIVNVLIYSAKNQREIETLLTYYYDRHINEAKNLKQSFLAALIEHHNVFDFDDNCWNAFNKILHNVDVYNHLATRGYTANIQNIISLTALIYHIVHKLDIPEALKLFINGGINWYYGSKQSTDVLYPKISAENQKLVFQYLITFYEGKITELNEKDTDEDVKHKIRQYISLVADLLRTHKRNVDDCPEIVMKYVKSHWNEYKHMKVFKKNNDDFSESLLLRCLKQDVKMVINKMPLVRENIKNDSAFRINQFLRKLKVYFPKDAAKEYLDCFVNMLSDELYQGSAYTAIYSIFQLADAQFKIDFMMKYVPKETKIDFSKSDILERNIQAGICKFACFSRPPVPLQNILMYIKGDYVRYCQPMFHSYLANLPLPLCLKFVEAILDAPVSIQKHGIRLAFECFSVENLKQLVTSVWKKTKNVSLRLVLYQALYNKIVDEAEAAQLELFETLKSFTLDLHENDDDEIYYLLTASLLPSNLLSKHIEFAWITVNKLPTKSDDNIGRKTAVINKIKNEIGIFDVKFVQTIVDEHIENDLVKARIRPSLGNETLQNMDILAKWELVPTYLVYFASNKEYLERNKEQARFIIKTCIEMWDVVHDEKYTWREFCSLFLRELVDEYRHNGSYEDAIPVFEVVIVALQQSLPLSVTYMNLWALRLHILDRRARQAGTLKICKENTLDGKTNIMMETVRNFAKDVADLIKESVESGSYFPFYVKEIQEMVSNKIMLIRYNLSEQMFDICHDSLHVVAAATLADISLAETRLLAVLLLPENCKPTLNEDYKAIINKVQTLDNEEIRFCIYNKFINSGFKRKYFME